MSKNIHRSISIILAIIFFLQAITHFSFIPLEKVLDFLGIGDGVFEIVMAIFYFALVIIGVSIVLSFLKHRKIVNRLTKNTIILNLISKIFIMFIIFFPTWISFQLLGYWGVFGEEIKVGLKYGKALSDLDQVTFLNLYLFWYFLITTFIKPEIDPS